MAYYWLDLRWKRQPNRAGVTAQHLIKIVGDPRISRCQLAHEALGRMNAIYTARLMERNKENGEANVFVHDAYGLAWGATEETTRQGILLARFAPEGIAQQGRRHRPAFH
ncbi:hypothetical protein OIU79_025348 [Salix purpurea]|uniref:Uncharacterized protein n=1 Tax=Salix purpurea TaxID=77065 RepID=A0A9Q1A6U3_SALPP|nr:hypothetical protein OIU79_025348 [Salix purpurea]